MAQKYKRMTLQESKARAHSQWQTAQRKVRMFSGGDLCVQADNIGNLECAQHIERQWASIVRDLECL